MTTEFTTVASTGKPHTEFSTGSRRDNRKGKGRFDLLSPFVLRRDAVHMENGAEKYGDRNWEKGQPLMTYLDSAFRHLMCLLEGKTDEDHAAAIRWNVGAFMWTLNEVESGRLPKELDNRPHAPYVPIPAIPRIRTVPGRGHYEVVPDRFAGKRVWFDPTERKGGPRWLVEFPDGGDWCYDEEIDGVTEGAREDCVDLSARLRAHKNLIEVPL